MTDPSRLAARRGARRTIQISQIFASVFGAAAINSRIRPVVAFQFVNTWASADALAWAQAQYGPLQTTLYGLASAPYFTLSPADSNRTDLTVDDVIARLQTSCQRLQAQFGVDRSWNGIWDYRNPPTPHTMAAFYHLKSMAYEGGPDTPGAPSLAARIAANHDPRMGVMLHDFLQAWYRSGNDMFMYFNLATIDDQNGQGGLYTDITVSTPKSTAVDQIIGQLASGQL